MKLPPIVHNRLTYAGTAVAVLALTAIVFLFIIDSMVGGEAPYAGLVIFIFLPAILLFGLALIPLGMWREWRHVQRTGHPSIPRYPVIDLNDARQRNAALIFVLGTLLLVGLTVFGSFQAYEATESVAFCGSTCHTVMEPERVAHARSAHARVRCVECHVGPGVDWYFRSKLNGAHQLYSVAFNSYPRPIPVPLDDLRPARETCEHCHWHEQHADVRRLKTRVFFLPDEQNTRWEIDVLVNVGGGELHAPASGIHWHLDPANTVEYLPADASRQEIPWVRVTDRRTGKTTEYLSTDSSLTPEEIAARAGEVRVMDCLDCHNRPSHNYGAPTTLVDQALRDGTIDAKLPFIKQQGSELLAGEYESVAEANTAIAEGLTAYYTENHPEVATQQGAAIVQAISTLQGLYRENFFPLMKARWDAYPDHSSHFMFPGCARCHDGLHESADGETVSNDCTTCHVITRQGIPGQEQFSSGPEGLDFAHPPIADLEDAWEDTPCTDCHAAQ